MRPFRFLLLSTALLAKPEITLVGIDLYPGAAPSTETWMLLALHASMIVIWLLVLLLTVKEDLAEINGQIGGQGGREAGALLKQRSIDFDDRYSALEQIAETTDQRRTLRRKILVRTLPYIALCAFGLLATAWNAQV